MNAGEHCSGAQFSSVKKAAYSVDLSFSPRPIFVAPMQFAALGARFGVTAANAR
jgi:hypothetical protein